MVKNPLANAGDMGLIPGLGRSPGEGNGGCKESDLTEHTHANIPHCILKRHNEGKGGERL